MEEQDEDTVGKYTGKKASFFTCDEIIEVIIHHMIPLLRSGFLIWLKKQANLLKLQTVLTTGFGLMILSSNMVD